jgi:hypothetical protein
MSKLLSNAEIWDAMARRKEQFHANEDWQTLRLWGLFAWQDVSRLLKDGRLQTWMKKENHTIWVYPSEDAYYKYIEPQLVHYHKQVSKV